MLIVNLTADGERSFTYLVHPGVAITYVSQDAFRAARIVLLQLNWPHRQSPLAGVLSEGARRMRIEAGRLHVLFDVNLRSGKMWGILMKSLN